MYFLPAEKIIGHDLRSGLLLNLVLTGGFNSARSKELLDRDTLRFEDICGEHIGLVMQQVGWSFFGPICHVVATDGEAAVATSWCALTKSHEGQYGINLTYAVAEDYEGMGLAKLTTAAVVLSFAQRLQLADHMPVNIQTKANNSSSIALATSLGFTPDSSRDFGVDIPGRGRVHYAGFTCPAGELIERCEKIAIERITVEKSTRQRRERERA